MRLNLLSSALLALTVLASSGTSQGHVVNISSLAFVDSVSGTSTTTIALGTTIQWVNSSGFSHTATSGSSNNPNAGALFNIPLPGGAAGTFAPTSAGTLSYFCIPHANFGMTGTIIVTPVASTYPGSGEDVRILTAITPSNSNSANTPTGGPGNDIKTATAGDYLTAVFDSPLGSFNGVPLLFLAEVFAPASPPSGPLGLSISVSGAVILANGTTPNALGMFITIAPGGTTFNYLLPAGLAGNSVMLQGLAVTNTANNGFFALSDAHEIQF